MNFILRTFMKDSSNQFNRSIGDSYIKKSKKLNLKNWKSVVESYFPEMKEEVIDTVECLIVGNVVLPVYNDESGYIMTENGQTFEKI